MQNHSFADEEGVARERGVVSWYALRALAQATTMDDWLERALQACQADVDAGRLTASAQPALQLVGDPAQPLPGVSLCSSAARR